MLPRNIKLQIFTRDGNKCLECGDTENLSIDHIKPIHLGGTNRFSNLRTLCVKCNSKKGNYEELSFWERMKQIWYMWDIFATFKTGIEGLVTAKLGDLEKLVNDKQNQITSATTKQVNDLKLSLNPVWEENRKLAVRNVGLENELKLLRKEFNLLLEHLKLEYKVEVKEGYQKIKS